MFSNIGIGSGNVAFTEVMKKPVLGPSINDATPLEKELIDFASGVVHKWRHSLWREENQGFLDNFTKAFSI